MILIFDNDQTQIMLFKRMPKVHTELENITELVMNIITC